MVKIEDLVDEELVAEIESHTCLRESERVLVDMLRAKLERRAPFRAVERDLAEGLAERLRVLAGRIGQEG